MGSLFCSWNKNKKIEILGISILIYSVRKGLKTASKLKALLTRNGPLSLSFSPQTALVLTLSLMLWPFPALEPDPPSSLILKLSWEMSYQPPFLIIHIKAPSQLQPVRKMSTGTLLKPFNLSLLLNWVPLKLWLEAQEIIELCKIPMIEL